MTRRSDLATLAGLRRRSRAPRCVPSGSQRGSVAVEAPAIDDAGHAVRRDPALGLEAALSRLPPPRPAARPPRGDAVRAWAAAGLGPCPLHRRARQLVRVATADWRLWPQGK